MPMYFPDPRLNQRTSNNRNIFYRHNLFKTNPRLENQNGAQSGSSRPLQSSGYDKILALNLSYSVKEEDLKELFTDFGASNVVINYNANGDPRRTALIEFSRPDGAMAAITRYNNVMLDGIKMRLDRVISESDKFSDKNLNRHNQKSSGNRVIPHNQFRKMKNKPWQRRRVIPEAISIKELDAQLEAYMKEADVQSPK